MFNFVPFENENAYICDLISYSDSLKEFSNNSFKSTSDDEKLQDKKEEKIETKDEKCPIIFIALNLEENQIIMLEIIAMILLTKIFQKNK